MKNKIFIGIAMSLFAVTTVFNMNISEQSQTGDMSLDAIEIMAQAEAESGLGRHCKFYPKLKKCCYMVGNFSYCPSWSCTRH